MARAEKFGMASWRIEIPAIGESQILHDRRFARQDSVEAAWRIVDPILKSGDRVQPYFKGSSGPPAADPFLGHKPD